jgi:hypothetical protein
MGPTAIPPLHVAEGQTPLAARLQLTVDRHGQPAMLDGAWWPRSRDLLEELPSLVAELRRQGGQVSRVSYHPDTWEPAPRTVTVDGGTVKLGWFRSMDPHLLTLTGVYGAGRLDLLVVPPDSLAAPADALMAAANEPDNRKTASAVLLADNVPLQKHGPFLSRMHDLSPA